MYRSRSDDWLGIPVEGGPAVVAAVMGAALIVVGLIFAFRLANGAARQLDLGGGAKNPGFDDAWWAVRQAAIFCLAVVSLGVLLLLVPAIGSGVDEPESSPSPAADPKEPEDPEEPEGEESGTSDPPTESGSPTPSPTGS